MKLELDMEEVSILLNALYTERSTLHRLIKTARIGDNATKDDLELWNKWYAETNRLLGKVNDALSRKELEDICGADDNDFKAVCFDINKRMTTKTAEQIQDDELNNQPTDELEEYLADLYARRKEGIYDSDEIDAVEYILKQRRL